MSSSNQRFAENGLAITPYIVETMAGRDVTITCQHNSSAADVGRIVIDHLTLDGMLTKVYDAGKLVSARLSRKYAAQRQDGGNGLQFHMVTLKSKNFYNYSSLRHRIPRVILRLLFVLKLIHF